MARAAALILSAALGASAAVPGQETVWDRLMRGQSARSVQEGALLLELGRYEQAVESFAKAVVSSPEEALPRVLLGAAYYWSGRVDEAMASYREALRLEPKHAQAHQLLGIAHAWKGDVEAAHAEFVEAARLDPERADVQMNLGSVLEARGELGAALERFRRAAELEPKHPLYHHQLGVLYARLGRDEQARAALKAALDRYPYYQDALLELGAVEERSGRPAEAVEQFRKAAKNKPRDSVARFRLAAALWRSGLRDEAREAMADAFHISPLEQGGRLALSVAYSGAKAPASPGSAPAADPPPPSDPVELFRRNLERLPADRKAKIEVQLVYLPRPTLQPGSVEGGRKGGGGKLKAALEGGPNPIAAKREFVLPAGETASRRKQTEAVVEDLRKVLEGRPEGQVHLGMNVQYEDEPRDRSRVGFEPRPGDNDLGLWVVGTTWVELVREALDGLPEDADLVRGLGRLTLGEGEAAEEEFGRAAAERPKDVLARLGVAVARVIRGRETEAAAAFREVQELDRRNRPAREALRWLERKGEPEEPGKPAGGS